MNCIVCAVPLKPYFVKPAHRGLPDQYHDRCPACGFVANRTICEMPEPEFVAFNKHFHESWQGKDYNDDDPRWRERMEKQVKAILTARGCSLLPDRPWLDYACGDGWLADGIGAMKWEPYMSPGEFHNEPETWSSAEEIEYQKFPFVVTTSVFEHLRTREHLDAINNLVSAGGVMGMHTLVCEEVPRDPDWFYLLPMHCAFFTNRSMELLLRQWGYTASAYHVEARLWLFFKGGPTDQGERARNAGFEYQPGFLDYWKAPPVRFNRDRPTTFEESVRDLVIPEFLRRKP